MMARLHSPLYTAYDLVQQGPVFAVRVTLVHGKSSLLGLETSCIERISNQRSSTRSHIGLVHATSVHAHQCWRQVGLSEYPWPKTSVYEDRCIPPWCWRQVGLSEYPGISRRHIRGDQQISLMEQAPFLSPVHSRGAFYSPSA